MADTSFSASGSSWWSEFRTVLLATLVTALIWIWAEGESVSRLSVPVRVAMPDGRAGAGNIIVDSPMLDDQSMQVVLRFEGSTLSLDQAATLRGVTINLEPEAPGLPTQAGANQVVDLFRALSAAPELVKLGLPLSSVEPSSLVVSATRLATRELPVRVELGRQVSLASEPQPSAQRVRVRVPEALASRLPDDAQAVAFISEDQLFNLGGETGAGISAGNGVQTVKATCRLPASLADVQPVYFLPETLNVTLRLRQAIETAKLPMSVPVWFSLPPTEDSSLWRIEVVEKFLTDLTVSGPVEQIARLRASAAAPGASGTDGTIKAFIELTSDELNPIRGEEDASTRLPIESSLTLTKPVIFSGLPASVSVVGTPTASVRIVRVSTSRPTTAATRTTKTASPAPQPASEPAPQPAAKDR